MIPRRLGALVFGLLLSGAMSCLVSGVATARVEGFTPALPGLWLAAWLTSWALAFPAVLIIAPLARRAVAALARED